MHGTDFMAYINWTTFASWVFKQTKLPITAKRSSNFFFFDSRYTVIKPENNIFKNAYKHVIDSKAQSSLSVGAAKLA